MGRGCEFCELPAGERDRLKAIRADGNSFSTVAQVAWLEELPVSRSGIYRHIRNHGEPKPPGGKIEPAPQSGAIIINSRQNWENELARFGGNIGEALRAARLRAKRASNHAAALRAKQGKT